MASITRTYAMLLNGYILSAVLGIVWSDCQDTWVNFEGSCYLFGTDTPLKFFEAENFCREHEGHLVHVDNARENAFLKHFFNALKPSEYWMGLTDERTEGLWAWLDTNTAPNFTDWYPGQPDNWESREDCAAFYSVFNYFWNDAGCDGLLEPICERRSEVTIIG